tara:strand:- start:6935 stop:7165 length:231 start_codon:yes stop_codon:yes gene_type:complete
MSVIVWKMTYEQKAHFLDKMTQLTVAEQRNDYDGYQEIVEDIKSLPNFPNDMDIEEDVCHVEIIQPVISDIGSISS